ncbi:MAG: hypothetical protein RR555_06435, partial [Bacteroidales bacterium]
MKSNFMLLLSNANWSTIIPITVLIGIFINILTTIPIKSLINTKNEIEIRFIIGSKSFPLNKITMYEIPEDIFVGLTRSFGTGLGKILSGHFYSKKYHK